MARRSVLVTWKKPDHDKLPDVLAEGVAFVLDLARRGVLEKVGQQMRIRRQGGYCGFDILLFLLLYFASATTTGLRKFWAKARPYRVQLAATAGQDGLASPASVSRALSAVEPELLRPASEWLLSEGAGIDTVLRHPAVLTYDARGEGWHVFDFDPTVTTLRHRALPERDDLPAARRRSELTAAPGYSGRKRGEVQFRRGTLQHAGSSAWMQAMLGPGNGDGHAELAAALSVVERTCERLDHPLSRALLLMDGAFGWVPYVTRCRARGVPCITRLTRPELLDQGDVLQTLREGSWHFVPDSLSGPRRSALDLGIVTVPPGQDTRKDDGTAYEPLDVRVVVSRYPRSAAAEHGRVIDGWQYELFVVDVEAEALPAPEAVAMFFGRAGQENRFAQEDREEGLDRIFSYHLPGQEFAVAVGLWVWNLELVRGFELSPPPAIRPAHEPYVAEIDLRVAVSADEPVDVPPSADTPKDAQCPVDSVSEDPTPGAASRGDQRAQQVPLGDEQPSTRAPSETTSSDMDSASIDEAQVDGEHTPEPVADDVVVALGRIDWTHLPSRHPGWSFDVTTGHLRCADGRELVLTTVRKGEYSPGRTGIIFCRPAGGCAPCDALGDCLRSSQPQASKHVEVFVPTTDAAPLRDLLRARRQARREIKRLKAAVASPRRSQRPGRTFAIAPLSLSPALFAVMPSLFLPAAARSLLRTAATGLTVTVNVELPPPPPPWPALVAKSVAHKQHRRATWQQHLDRHALPPEAHVRVEIAGGGALRRMLGGGGDDQAAE